MATKEKSVKPKTTPRRKKKDPVAGSPVTIGGGAGKRKTDPAFIEFVDGDWNYQPGKLTRKDGENRITTVVLTHAVSGPIKFPDIGLSKIEVNFD